MKVLKNRKQASATKKKIDELTSKIKVDDLTAMQNDSNTFAIGKIKELINELSSQLNFYNELTSGKIKALDNISIFSLPQVLIAARLAQNKTHKQLGDIIGIDEQQIQRYEAKNYEQANWVRIIEVIHALELEINLSAKLVKDKTIKLSSLNSKRRNFERQAFKENLRARGSFFGK